MTLFDLYDNIYKPFTLPFLFLNTSIHPSRSSLLNLCSSQDRMLSNSLNLSLSKYPSEFRNNIISRSD